MKRRLLTALVGAMAMACTAWAQQEEEPGRGVARISLMNGDVSVRRADSGDWVAAAANAPLMAEDRLATAAGARAEIQLDAANLVRLASLTEVRLAQLENGRFQLQLARGLVTFRVLRESPAQGEISTPSVAIRAVKQGTYRIVVREDGTTEITVRDGEAEIVTAGGSERLPAGQTMMVRGESSDPEFQVVAAPAEDAWDGWNAQRDQIFERSRSYNYVSQDVYGAEDLDANGTWVDVPPYGPCWYPRVANDWAPYRNGRWVWMDWYGWTWVSYDPWGWAPYHYGRWFHASNYGWCWWPGDRHGHHYWSPGMVAFVGWDNWGGSQFGIGFGGIGWIPLAPYERYHPWYGRGFYGGYRNGYFGGGMHVMGNVNIGHMYRNARFANGITAVDSRGFISGRSGGALRGGADLSRGSLVRGMLPVTPGRESLRMSDRQVRTTGFSQGGREGRFFNQQQSARSDRISFEQQQRGMAQAQRQTFSEARGMQGATAGAGGATTRSTTSGSGWRQAGGSANSGGAATMGTTSNSNSWRRFGEPASNRTSMQGGGASRNAGDGWNRFGTGTTNTSGRATSSGSMNSRSSGTAAGSGMSRSSSTPVRISPQIVRERSTSSGNSGGSASRPSGGNGGGGSNARGGGGGGERGGRGR